MQAWKDTLLRGYKQNDFDKYHETFKKQEADVQSKAKELKELLTALKLDTSKVDDFLKEHAELGVKYREALKHYGSGNIQSAHIVDDMVRGMDQEPTDLIDSIAATMLKNQKEEVVSASDSRSHQVPNGTVQFDFHHRGRHRCSPL